MYDPFHFPLALLLTCASCLIAHDQIRFKVNEKCKRLCEPIKLSKEAHVQLNDLILHNYQAHWQMDELPVASRSRIGDSYDFGFPLGKVGGSDTRKKAFLNNHVTIKIHYTPHVPLTRQADKMVQVGEDFNIVMFEVEPSSREYDVDKWESQCNSGKVDRLEIKGDRYIHLSPFFIPLTFTFFFVGATVCDCVANR